MASAGSGRRVLIIVQNLPVPFDRRVWLEATTLARHGYQVSVICPKAKGYGNSFEKLEDVDIYRYALPIDAQGVLGFLLEFAWCFLCTFAKSVAIAWSGRGFDVIHACNPPETFWLLGWFWRVFGVRFLFDHHDLSPEMYRAKFTRPSALFHSGLLFLERMSFWTADVVITTNESHKAVALGRGGHAEGDVFVVRSGPDFDRLRRFEADISWKKGKPHLLVYLGEICRQDGVDHLVRAVRHLRDRHGRDDFHAVFIGGGPHQPVIRAYADTLGVAECCTFTGRVSDEMLCRILSSADLAVDPDPKNDWSDRSTMNKVMEYLFFGLPIVAYDLAETRVSAGPAAAYARPNSDADLADCIDRLLADAESRQAMSAAGLVRLRDGLLWEHSVPALLAAYERLFERVRRVSWRGRQRKALKSPRVGRPGHTRP